MLNATSHGKLPPQNQKLVEDAKHSASAAIKQAYAEADLKFIPEFKMKGIAFIRFTEVELAQFRKVAAEPVREEWVQKREAQGIAGRELLKAVLEAAKAASN